MVKNLFNAVRSYSEPGIFYSEPRRNDYEPGMFHSEPVGIYCEPEIFHSEPVGIYSEPVEIQKKYCEIEKDRELFEG